MQSLNLWNGALRAATWVAAASLLMPAQTAQKPGPPIPPGTGGPGGTSQAARMQDFLAIGAPPDPATAARGKDLFVGTCGFCHGANAKGGESGPDLVRSVLVLHDENGDKIGPVIHGGRPGKGMPAFPNITNAQVSDIAAFLKSRYQAAANRGAYQIQNIVTGDARAGEVYFKEKCSSCHSPTGDLAGIANRYEPDGLQNRFLYPQEHGRGESVEKPKGSASQVTVTLPSGQSFSGTLEHLDDFNVALTDASGAYYSWPLGDETGIKVSVTDPLAAHLELLKHYSNSDMHNILAYLETLK
jgi:cytochrome c oxidase cbb3-type subunit 3